MAEQKRKEKKVEEDFRVEAEKYRCGENHGPRQG
jgi:hypothetical protein